MTCIIIFAIIYLLSVIGSYNYIRNQYLKGGEWNDIEPCWIDIFMVFTPALNTMICIGIISSKIYDKISKYKIELLSSLPKKFFNLKDK